MTLRSSWIDSSLELAMATIRAIEVPSPGSWGCRRIASRKASPPRVDPGVTAIQILSPHPRFSARLRRTVRAGHGRIGYGQYIGPRLTGQPDPRRRTIDGM